MPSPKPRAESCDCRTRLNNVHDMPGPTYWPSYEIIYCPLHAAAPDLFHMLKLVRAVLTKSKQDKIKRIGESVDWPYATETSLKMLIRDLGFVIVQLEEFL